MFQETPPPGPERNTGLCVLSSGPSCLGWARGQGYAGLHFRMETLILKYGVELERRGDGKGVSRGRRK